MSEVFTVVCALLGVIGLIFLTYYATRWLNKKFRSTGYNGSQNGIKILECMGIAQDKQLLAVKVGRKALLLGVTPNSITALSELDDDDIAEMTAASENGSGGGFTDILKKAVSGRTPVNEGDKKSSGREESYGRDEKNSGSE